MNIDYEELRQDLMDYYGTAKEFNPLAAVDLIEVENATNSELIYKARSIGIELSNYIDDIPYTKTR